MTNDTKKIKVQAAELEDRSTASIRGEVAFTVLRSPAMPGTSIFNKWFGPNSKYPKPQSPQIFVHLRNPEIIPQSGDENQLTLTEQYFKDRFYISKNSQTHPNANNYRGNFTAGNRLPGLGYLTVDENGNTKLNDFTDKYTNTTETLPFIPDLEPGQNVIVNFYVYRSANGAGIGVDSVIGIDGHELKIKDSVVANAVSQHPYWQSQGITVNLTHPSVPNTVPPTETDNQPGFSNQVNTQAQPQQFAQPNQAPQFAQPTQQNWQQPNQQQSQPQVNFGSPNPEPWAQQVQPNSQMGQQSSTPAMTPQLQQAIASNVASTPNAGQNAFGAQSNPQASVWNN